VVAAASGKLDGALTVLGVVIGSVLYAEVQPSLGAFHDSGKLGRVFLYELLHLPPLLLAVLVAGVAVLTFKGATLIEQAVARAQAARAVPPANP
jgi:hypothetical protein